MYDYMMVILIALDELYVHMFLFWIGISAFLIYNLVKTKSITSKSFFRDGVEVKNRDKYECN
jgi:hypothetical protein